MSINSLTVLAKNNQSASLWRWLAPGFLGVAFTCAGIALPLHAQAPQELIQGPRGMTPTAYYALSLEAGRLYQQRDMAAAKEAYEHLTAAYPWDSGNWFWLGYTRYQGGDYRGAAQAFERAHALGVPAYARSLPAYAARAYVHSGQSDKALEWLERALEEYHYELPSRLLQDSAFAILREEPRFQALAPPQIDSTTARVEGWRSDLDFLLSQVQLLNPVYSQRPLPDSMVQAARKLRESVPTLTDAQVAVEMQRLLVMLGQAHNTFYFPYNPPEENARVAFTRLPLEFYLFPDGLHVTAASAPHEDLIGARVLRFDDTPAVQALEATATMNDRENEVEVAQATTFLGMPQVLHALGLIQSPEQLTLAVRDSNGRERSVRVDAVSYEESRGLSTEQSPPDSPALPLSLRRSGEPFWFDALPTDEALYVQFNAVVNSPEESLSQFGLRLRQYLSKDPDLRNLIVDMRRNNGGNSYLYTELLRTLIDFDSEEGNRLFVLIGRRTYSAAGNFIVDVDRLTNAIFVGEPSGGKPTTVGSDLAMIVLPYSQLRVGLASATWALSGPRDRRLWIAPDVPVALRAEDHFAGRDPAIETITAIIRADAGK